MNLGAYKDASNPKTIEAFRLELFKELEIQETKHNLNLFTRAWQYAHLGGFEEVYFMFVDLVDMEDNATGQL